MQESSIDTLRLEWRDAQELQDNPRNWRRHPPTQQQAVKDLLSEVGWAGTLLYNETTGRLIDGHLRKEVAVGERVPVLVGNWTEEQERKILLTLDPITAMAEQDEDALLALLRETQVDSEAIAGLLDALADEAAPWEPNIQQVQSITPTNSGITANLRIRCPTHQEEELRLALEGWLESAFPEAELV